MFCLSIWNCMKYFLICARWVDVVVTFATWEGEGVRTLDRDYRAGGRRWHESGNPNSPGAAGAYLDAAPEREPSARYRHSYLRVQTQTRFRASMLSCLCASSARRYAINITNCERANASQNQYCFNFRMPLPLSRQQRTAKAQTSCWFWFPIY